MIESGNVNPMNKLSCVIAIAACLNAIARAEDGGEFFEKNIRPLLVRNCQACHFSATSPMGGLRLDSREGMLKGGSRGPAIVPGKPAASLLLRAVRQNESLKMPPAGKLKEAEIALLAEWIEMGAPWGSEKTQQTEAPKQKFWAFIPPREPAAPQVKNPAWVKSPIDGFVLAALEAKGLAPAPQADKRTLIRRATFDLTGLPPTPEEVETFLKDERPDAFARVVDRLLASPRYGERWGRHWLDVARYADSNGMDENLVYRQAFRYRDYVIAAFNKDKPYDLFIKEQLAGDLLPGPVDEATQFERWTATGFLSLGAKMLAEDDPVKMQMDIVDEQLDTTSRAFMGMTVGCARCHDHKFDPIPTADYYSMAGIFESSRTMENFKVVAKWHEYVLAPEPERLALAAHLAKIAAKTKEIGALTAAENNRLAAEARAHIGEYLVAALEAARYDRMALRPAAAGGKIPAGAILRASGSFERGNAPRKLAKANAADEDSGDAPPKGVKGPFYAEYDITAPAAGEYQLDMLEEETGRGTADVWINGVLEKRGLAAVTNREASPDSGGWSVTGVFSLAAGKNTIRLEHKATFPYFQSLLISALDKGVEAPRTREQVARQHHINAGFLEQWEEELRRSRGAPHSVLLALLSYAGKHTLAGDALAGWTSPAAPRFQGFEPKSAEDLAAHYQRLFDEADAQWQEYKKTLPPEPKAADADEGNGGRPDPVLPDAVMQPFHELAYAKAGPFRAPKDAREFYAPAARESLTRLEAELKSLEDSTPDLPKAMGVTEGKTGDIQINIRGSHWTLGEKVPRRFLRVIAGENQAPIPEGQSGRLQLAEWLARPDHPLTGRVMVNRIWRWHFGRGIVASTDNFGRLGELPSNQPLLDWLALKFVESGWSIKQMQRTIMLSSTYQMSSRYNEQAAETDPEDTLLWRFNRQRLEAEEIRDAVTDVSGVIDFSAGGTLLHYKDRQYVASTSKRGGIDYDAPRRAVYIPVLRSSMYEMFQAFDLPDPATENGDRKATVIAPQALFAMNSTLVLKCTRAMAEGLLKRTDLDDAGRIREAYQRALARPPAAKDVDRALTFIAKVEAAMEHREPDEAKRRLFAWQSFCKVLMASNEFIYVN